MSDTPLLNVQKLTKSYGPQVACRDVSFTV